MSPVGEREYLTHYLLHMFLVDAAGGDVGWDVGVGSRCDGSRCDGVSGDGFRCDGFRCDGFRCDGSR
jgi:hypothetical protein